MSLGDASKKFPSFVLEQSSAPTMKKRIGVGVGVWGNLGGMKSGIIWGCGFKRGSFCSNSEALKSDLVREELLVTVERLAVHRPLGSRPLGRFLLGESI